MGVWQNDRVRIVANDLGIRTTPYVPINNEYLSDGAAKNQVTMNTYVLPIQCASFLTRFVGSVFDAKRLACRKLNDLEVQAGMRRFPFKVFSKNSKPYIEFNHRGEKKQFVS